MYFDSFKVQCTWLEECNRLQTAVLSRVEFQLAQVANDVTHAADVSTRLVIVVDDVTVRLEVDALDLAHPQQEEIFP